MINTEKQMILNDQYKVFESPAAHKHENFNLSTPYWETPWSPVKEHDFLSPYFNMIL